MRANVHRSTVSRWERGAHEPSRFELDALLAALHASPEEGAEALQAVQAPRAQERRRKETILPPFAQDMGSPVGGDLLRAMRRRQGKTQEEVARAIGVQRTTLTRWERSETWPDASQLHALCFALNAHPMETAALTVGRFSPARCLEWLRYSEDGCYPSGCIRILYDIVERILYESGSECPFGPALPDSPGRTLEDRWACEPTDSPTACLYLQLLRSGFDGPWSAVESRRICALCTAYRGCPPSYRSGDSDNCSDRPCGTGCVWGRLAYCYGAAD